MSQKIPPSLLRWALPPRKFRYVRVGFAGDFALPRLVVEETWGDPVVRDGDVTFRRTSRVDGQQQRVIEDALVGYGPDGLMDLGTWDRAGVLSLWDPPQLVLPCDPVIGMTWESEHTQGDTHSHRSVEVVKSPTYQNGLMVLATSKRASGMLVMRSHYVEGEGFCGFEALARTPERPSVRMWSETVTITQRHGLTEM